MTPQIVPAQRAQHERAMQARANISAASRDPLDVMARELKTLRQANASLRYSLSVADAKVDEYRARLEEAQREVRALASRVNSLEDDHEEFGVLLDIACQAFGARRSDVLSHRRQAQTLRARLVFYWLARRFTTQSFPDIGIFARRDHTTVLYGVNRVQTLVARIGDPARYDPASWAAHIRDGWSR